jgi:hypothetical protein
MEKGHGLRRELIFDSNKLRRDGCYQALEKKRIVKSLNEMKPISDSLLSKLCHRHFKDSPLFLKDLFWFLFI